jgi:hypothetical protein
MIKPPSPSHFISLPSTQDLLIKKVVALDNGRFVIWWTCEHEQIFFGILFDTWDRIFGDVEEYFSMCSWMKKIYGWKMKMDDFLWTLTRYNFFCENLNNKNKVEQI